MANILANAQELWLDLLMGTIVVFNIIDGLRKGAMGSLFSLIGWGVAIFVAFLVQPITASFIRDYTPIYDAVRNIVQDNLPNEMLDKSSAVMTQYLKLPEVLENILNNATKTIAYALSESISVLCINILTFVMLVFCIKFIAYLLNEVTKSMKKIAIIKGFDRILGIVVGAARGIVIVAIIMALLVPVISITNSKFLNASINKSRISKIVYDKNYIFLLVKQMGGHKNSSENILLEDMESNGEI